MRRTTTNKNLSRMTDPELDLKLAHKLGLLSAKAQGNGVVIGNEDLRDAFMELHIAAQTQTSLFAPTTFWGMIMPIVTENFHGLEITIQPNGGGKVSYKGVTKYGESPLLALAEVLTDESITF